MSLSKKTKIATENQVRGKLKIKSKTVELGSVGTVLFQWGVALAVFIIFNKFITKKLSFEQGDAGESHDD